MDIYVSILYVKGENARHGIKLFDLTAPNGYVPKFDVPQRKADNFQIS